MNIVSQRQLLSLLLVIIATYPRFFVAGKRLKGGLEKYREIREPIKHNLRKAKETPVHQEPRLVVEEEKRLLLQKRYLAASNAKEIIPGKYTSQFLPGMNKKGTKLLQQLVEQQQQQQHNKAEILSCFDRAIQGCTVAGIDNKEVMTNFLLENLNVFDTVEEDVQIHASSAYNWGIDRIDQPTLPLDSSYDLPNGLNGSGVDIYIIDWGIESTHQEFNGGRVVESIDLNGDEGIITSHGTHVAAIAAGANVGVAPGANLYDVKIFGSNPTSFGDVIGAIDWVIASAETTGRRSVINLSLEGQASQTMNDAIQNAVNADIVVVAAAGNGSLHGVNACTISPASSAYAITVAASTINDNRFSHSNYGACIDLFAPGVSIRSASGVDVDGSSHYSVLTGTSMSAAHVSGAAALYLEANPAASASSVGPALVDMALDNVIYGAWYGSPNKLLYVGSIGDTPSPTTSPTASPTSASPTSSPVVSIEAIDDAFVTDEDTDAVGNVLSNDKGQGTLEVSEIVTGPSNGSVSMNADGIFTYTPNMNWNGLDTFEYKTTDAEGAADTATVTITVNPVNDAPVANDDSYSANQDTEFLMETNSVLDNDTDPESDAHVVTAILTSSGSVAVGSAATTNEGGTVTMQLDGTFHYMPPTGFSGYDQFQYVLSDGNGGSNVATVSIMVIASPTFSPTASPSASPTTSPTASPSAPPTASPTHSPTAVPSSSPTISPSGHPTTSPTGSPTGSPSDSPTGNPSAAPTKSPSASPTARPSISPTARPTEHIVCNSSAPAMANGDCQNLCAGEARYNCIKRARRHGSIAAISSSLCRGVLRRSIQNGCLPRNFEQLI